jgi:L-asparaginase II
MPFIESGGHLTYNLTQEEIAIICASHAGTDQHKAVIESIQAKTCVLESDLLCGVHAPGHRETAQALKLRGEEPTSGPPAQATHRHGANTAWPALPDK